MHVIIDLDEKADGQTMAKLVTSELITRDHLYELVIAFLMSFDRIYDKDGNRILDAPPCAEESPEPAVGPVEDE